jgi:Tol biopolymer transport system component
MPAALKPLQHNAGSESEAVLSTPQVAVSPGTPRPAPVHERTSESLIVSDFVKRHWGAILVTIAIVVALIGLTWFQLRRPVLSPAELTQKRLTFNSSDNPVQRSAISPDGKYLAYSDAAGIHIKLLSTGEEHLIPKPARVPADAAWAVDSWFPDGTQLLADTSEAGGHGSMWAVSAMGQSARELREDAKGYEVSPDGTHIAFAPPPTPGSSGNPREIWMMDSQGESAHKIVASAPSENEGLGDVHWSPDGRRLAYSRAKPTQGGGSQFATIESCDLKGTSRTLIVSESDLPLGDFRWLPDGRIVYARSNESSDGDSLWQIAVDATTGTPVGKPKRITQGAGLSIESLSASADGKQLAVLQTTELQQIYLAELAAGGMRLLSPPRRWRSEETYDRASAWTADSQAILFDSNSGSGGIFKQGIKGDTTQLLVGDGFWPRLSADGAWVIYPQGAPMRVMRVPVNGGVPQFVVEAPKALDGHCTRAPANLCVALAESQDDKQLVVRAFDPLTGTVKELRTIEKDPSARHFGSDLSPDGSTFAIARSGEAPIRIRLLSLVGGPDREITVKGWSNLAWAGLYWSADGKGIYAGSLSPEVSTLLYVDLKGNAQVLWRNSAIQILWGMPSPDGRYLAIEGMVSNRNVWMLGGF